MTQDTIRRQAYRNVKTGDEVWVQEGVEPPPGSEWRPVAEEWSPAPEPTPAQEPTFDEVMRELSDRLRGVVEIGKVGIGYAGNPDQVRRMALVRTKAEEALLYALFGDRV